MKRFTIVALALALGLGFASAQNITKSLQGSQDPRGPVGQDTSNAMYFPGHINAFGQLTATPSSASCTGAGPATAVTAGSTDVAGSIVAANTTCSVYFGSPFNATPSCVIGSTSAAASPMVATVTPTTTGFNLGTTVSGATYNWICIGNK